MRNLKVSFLLEGTHEAEDHGDAIDRIIRSVLESYDLFSRRGRISAIFNSDADKTWFMNRVAQKLKDRCHGLIFSRFESDEGELEVAVTWVDMGYKEAGRVTAGSEFL